MFRVVKTISANEGKENNKVVMYEEETNVVTKFAFATRVGHQPNNPNKVNQDAFILAPNILNLNYMHYFGVCDGHGQYGKDVSTIIKQKLPALLEENLYKANKENRDAGKSSTEQLLHQELLPTE